MSGLRLVAFAILIVCVFSQQKALRSRRLGLESQILSRITGSDYDVHSRPPVRGCLSHDLFVLCLKKDEADHSAIVVIVSVYLNRIVWHDEYAEVDLTLRQQWEDGRLSYEVDPREGFSEISLPSNKKIWTPDTYFSNGKEKGGDSKERTQVMVEPSGYVRASEGRTVYVPIEYGTSFPFLNRRSFKLRLSSYNYPLEDVVYLWANSPPQVVPVEVSDDLMDGSIKFEEVAAGDCVGNYTVGMFSCIDVDVIFSSGVFGSFAKVFLPSILLIIASWLHFWVHGSWSVPRTISAALPFFIFAVIFLFRSDLITSSSGVRCWMTFGLIITFLSFLEYFLVICCGIRRSIRYVNSGSHADESPLTAAKETMEVAYDSRCASFRNNNGVDLISRVLFPIIFIIWCIIYFFVLY